MSLTLNLSIGLHLVPLLSLIVRNRRPSPCRGPGIMVDIICPAQVILPPLPARGQTALSILKRRQCPSSSSVRSRRARRRRSPRRRTILRDGSRPRLLNRQVGNLRLQSRSRMRGRRCRSAYRRRGAGKVDTAMCLVSYGLVGVGGDAYYQLSMDNDVVV